MKKTIKINLIEEMEKIAYTDENLKDLVDMAIENAGASYYIAVLYDFETKKAWVERRQSGWISPEEFNGENTFLEVAKIDCQNGLEDFEDFIEPEDFKKYKDEEVEVWEFLGKNTFIEYYLDELFYHGYEWMDKNYLDEQLDRIIPLLGK